MKKLLSQLGASLKAAQKLARRWLSVLQLLNCVDRQFYTKWHVTLPREGCSVLTVCQGLHAHVSTCCIHWTLMHHVQSLVAGLKANLCIHHTDFFSSEQPSCVQNAKRR